MASNSILGAKLKDCKICRRKKVLPSTERDEWISEHVHYQWLRNPSGLNVFRTTEAEFKGPLWSVMAEYFNITHSHWFLPSDGMKQEKRSVLFPTTTWPPRQVPTTCSLHTCEFNNTWCEHTRVINDGLPVHQRNNSFISLQGSDAACFVLRRLFSQKSNSQIKDTDTQIQTQSTRRGPLGNTLDILIRSAHRLQMCTKFE